MSDAAAHVDAILAPLRQVQALRAEREADAGLGACVTLLKQYQQQRFAKSYADLLATPRYAGAARFFLHELYGPEDYTRRDAQFARVVPALVRMFPAAVVDTVLTLAQLHALSEALDSQMARHLLALRPAPAGTPPAPIRPEHYVAIWNATGRASDRFRQIELTIGIGASLDRLTRNRLLRHGLHLMRGPAQAAGLAQLQAFLESGFDTFAGMRGAEEFLTIVRQREIALAQALFAAGPAPGQTAPPIVTQATPLLEQLP